MNRIHVLSNQFDSGLISPQEATAQALDELARLVDRVAVIEQQAALRNLMAMDLNAPGKPAPTGPLDAPAYPDRMSDVLLDAATGLECKAIPVKDYDAALSMLRLLRRMIDDPAYQISDLQRKVSEIIDTIERGEAT